MDPEEIRIQRSFRRDVIKILGVIAIALIALVIFSFAGVWYQGKYHEEEEAQLRDIIKNLYGNRTLDRRDDIPDVNVIMPHPYSEDYMMTGFAIPDTQIIVSSNQTVDQDDLDASSTTTVKRIAWLWWTFAAIKLAFTGVGIMGITYSCLNWSQGHAQWWDKVGCVVGAVATVVGIGATGARYGLEYDVIRRSNHPWLSNIEQAWNSKRDTNAPAYYMGNLTQLTAAFANVTGMPTATLVKDDLNIALNDQTGWPIHIVMNEYKQLMHVSVMKLNSTGWTFRTIDPAIYNTNVFKRSEDFNMENFSNGGIEASVDYESPSHSTLSMQYDWQQLTDQVACTFGDMSGNAYQYQIFDNNHDDTLTAGVIRAFTDEPFDEFTLAPNYVHWPVPDQPQCHVS